MSRSRIGPLFPLVLTLLLAPPLLLPGCGDPAGPDPRDPGDPIAEWTVIQRFGAWNAAWQAYHLAVDLRGDAGAPIGALRDGVVRVAATGVPGYGAVVVIEHPVATGAVMAIYGHLSTRRGLLVREGETVSAGQTIGTLADTDEDGGPWGPHLHLGLRAGPDAALTGLCGVWPYVGYTRQCGGVTHEEFMADGWLDPETFDAGP